MAQAGRRGHLIPPLRRFKVYESLVIAFYESGRVVLHKSLVKSKLFKKVPSEIE